MKLSRPFLAVLLVSLAPLARVHGQDSLGLPFEQKMDVVYGEVHGTGLLMDVFTPRNKTNGLAIVDVVSGAYWSDRRKIRDHMLAQVYTVFCSRGYTVFALRPGSRSRYTGLEMVEHVRIGIRFVKQHAADYHIEPNRLGLTGASAGGHLALLAAVTSEDGKPDEKGSVQAMSTAVQAAAIFFPPTDFLDWNGKPADFNTLGDLLFLGGIKGRAENEIEERARQLSPVRRLTGPAIPLLLIHGDADPLVPIQQSRKMVDAVKAAGGSAELMVKPGGGHPWLTIAEEVRVMADWFDRRLPETKN
jgi:acetyl esterase/lipase